MARRYDAPCSLLTTGDELAALLTREQTLALARQVQGYMSAEDSSVIINSGSRGETDIALSQVQGGADGIGHSLSFDESFEQGRRTVGMMVNELDEAALRAAVAKAEALAKAEVVLREPPLPGDPLRSPAPVNPALWSDASAALVAAEARYPAVETMLAATEKAGVFGYGHVKGEPNSLGVMAHADHFEYGRTSTCEISVMARTKDGTGSGWAAWRGEDWTKANPQALAERAIDLAQRSRNPVAVEPGRWTVVMSPEACGELVTTFSNYQYGQVLSGPAADAGRTPFSKPGGGNKIGLKVLDERVTLSIDPMDPEAGFLPFGDAVGLQYVPVTWVDRGVLKILSYPTRAEAATRGVEQVDTPWFALRMHGGPTSVEEMIANTERGIYVTRFSNVNVVHGKTLYMTGVTRDGTFLIEKGKITKPVKNLRFEDSPMFFLNNLDAIGPAKRVAIGLGSYSMPAIKVRDFAFTSLTDAV